MAHKILTIGYARWDALGVHQLVAEEAAILFDVRFRPNSSKPGFSREALQRKLRDRYCHLPGFGNTNYRGGEVNLSNPGQAFDTVVKKVSPAVPAILMCGCADHRRCHRSHVAAYLKQHWPAGCEVSISHRYPEGRTPSPTLFDALG